MTRDSPTEARVSRGRTVGSSLASVLPLQPSASLAVILTTGSVLALLVFLPVALHQPRAEPSGSGSAPESTGG